ncbi:MAG: 5-formyltetrahydrofolate cyclo-ligase [Zetaproteobacteria bacterium]|nr:5-formyltetrahydrofolate cyclo-ligase [Pseudobdellovibrionaceae bacterium]|tara:strand:+ start:35 stop:634 length:600 start_codon:yes stop_codon:yes gene_type:complete
MTLANDEVISLKKKLRKDYISQRNALTPQMRKQWSQLICENIRKFVTEKNIKQLLLFAPFRSEPDLLPLVSLLTGVSHGFPLMGADRTMTFYSINDLSDLVPNSIGIPEPRPDHLQTMAMIDTNSTLVLVPALAVDKHGSRLGYGGGYYDRWLTEQPDHLMTMGVTFSPFLFEPFLPKGELDRTVQWSVTNDGIIPLSV